MKVSKGDVFSVSASPESNETALTLPVVFFIIVLITTELGIYSIISTIINAFDFSTSDFSTCAFHLPFLDKVINCLYNKGE